MFISYLAENQILVFLAPIFGANEALLFSPLPIHHRFATATAKALLGVGRPILHVLLLHLRKCIGTIISSTFDT